MMFRLARSCVTRPAWVSSLRWNDKVFDGIPSPSAIAPGVKPSLVFELGFEGINRSARHKSGIAVRFPRMLRIRDDKPLHEADSLVELEALLAVVGT